jgi:hypothetical protein
MIVVDLGNGNIAMSLTHCPESGHQDEDKWIHNNGIGNGKEAQSSTREDESRYCDEGVTSRKKKMKTASATQLIIDDFSLSRYFDVQRKGKASCHNA